MHLWGIGMDKSSKWDEDHFKGCLLGGAIGDALGYTVEFMQYDEITNRFGQRGITELVLSNGKALISDDTQMTLFTAEGCIRGYNRVVQHTNWDCGSHPNPKGERSTYTMSATPEWYAYRRWLCTQDGVSEELKSDKYKGWLVTQKGLYARRAPGNSCLSAIRANTEGTIENPINDSKGCGGVMRVAPVGLVVNSCEAFDFGCKCAALTHGHPSGYIAAGMFADIISNIIEGTTIEDAISHSLSVASDINGSEESINAVQKAIENASSKMSDVQAIKDLGQGWVAEEALAIAVYCALKYKDDYKSAVVAAVNHDGDSDSTGSITGNILGAYLGISAIPTEWQGKLELRELIDEVACDLLMRWDDPKKWFEKHPGC